MAESEMSIPEHRRKLIFVALVNAQDDGESTAVSRRHVARDFGLTETQVREIEEEGLNACWPPLS